MADQDAFFYPHTCIITRPSGIDASTGVETSVGVYSGICGLDIGSSGNTTLRGFQEMASYKVIIPTCTVVLRKNDNVDVTSENGRITKSTIEDFNPCSWPGMEGITIYLAKGVDV